MMTLEKHELPDFVSILVTEPPMTQELQQLVHPLSFFCPWSSGLPSPGWRSKNRMPRVERLSSFLISRSLSSCVLLCAAPPGSAKHPTALSANFIWKRTGVTINYLTYNYSYCILKVPLKPVAEFTWFYNHLFIHEIYVPAPKTPWL